MPVAATRTLRRTRRAAAAVLPLLGMSVVAAPAAGEWPTDPSTPLVLGDVLGVGSVRHLLAATPDGAVWAAWISQECFGALQVQRVGPNGDVLTIGGLALDPRTDCLARSPLLAPCSDDSIIVCGTASSTSVTPVRRIASDGTQMWTNGEADADIDTAIVGAVLGLANGDALVAWHGGLSVFVGRYAADGHAVWPAPTEIPTNTGSNKRIFSLVPDGADGAFVFWDQPSSYTNVIDVARVDAVGAPAWRTPLRIVPLTPGSSRHSDPAAIADGRGGALLAWPLGFEQAGNPAPLFLEHVGADGTPLLPQQTIRVSLATTRQFDPHLALDAATSEVLVAWRDGVSGPNDLRVQRMTLEGTRLWGANGVFAASIGALGSSRFDAAWTGTDLALCVADNSTPPDAPRVQIHRVAGGGSIPGPAWPISGPEAAGTVRLARLPGAFAVSWIQDGPTFDDHAVAQRVNDDGSLGVAPLVGDIDGDGTIGFGDLLEVLAAWGPCGPPCPADLDADDAVGLADLLIVLSLWSIP